MPPRSPQVQRLSHLNHPKLPQPPCTSRNLTTTTAASPTPSKSQPLQKRTVVGSFLFRRTQDGQPKVALFKRSSAVKTYAHKYGCVSGGVEPTDASPFRAALREIHEETNLTPQDVRYLCLGKPWSFVDRGVDYEWSVHPFAFLWPEGREGSLRLGWEHEGHAWFAPHAIKEEETAAGVVESLRRVWPEGDLGRIPVLTGYILGDATEGGKDARHDPDAAFTVFRKAVSSITTKDSVQWRRGVRLTAWHVWNHSDRSIKTPLLSRLVSGLELLEQLLAPQHVSLAHEFEKLAAMALENVAMRSVEIEDGQEKGMGRGTEGEEELRLLTSTADRFFSGLWKEDE